MDSALMREVILATMPRHEKGDPCTRVRVRSALTGLQVCARWLGGWTALNRVGWVKPSDVRSLQGRHRHALVIVHGWRRGRYYLAIHWTTAARKLGGCVLLVTVEENRRA